MAQGGREDQPDEGMGVGGAQMQWLSDQDHEPASFPGILATVVISYESSLVWVEACLVYVSLPAKVAR